MNEPEVALAFTGDLWVEELHRHLTDHGGARVRTLLVEPEGATEESYDVLVAGHRWPALTHALVADVHAQGRAIVGVHDREEPASREHLFALGITTVVESDAGPDAFVRAIVGVTRSRDDQAVAESTKSRVRGGRIVTVGGNAGTGRTEIAIELTLALGRRSSVVLVDADDVAPGLAPRLQLPVEPNVRTAIDAIEHGRGDFERCVLVEPTSRMRGLSGLAGPGAWAQIRAGEVVRVIDRLAEMAEVVVCDGAGLLEEVSTSGGRGRFATARAVVAESDVVLAVCDASPRGVARLLSWCVDAIALAPQASLVVVVNRAPDARFRRGELYEEIRTSLPLVDVAFVPFDRRVGDAAWAGTPVGRGGFTRAVERLAALVAALCQTLDDLVPAAELAS